MHSNQHGPYRSLAWPARILLGAFAVYGASRVAAACVELVAATRPPLHDHSWSYGEIDRLYAWVGLTSGIQVAALLACGVLFLIWIHRASKNARALGAEAMQYSPGWAVGGFFVPILNLWRPFQVVAEIWRASDPRHPGGHAWALEKAPLPTFLPFWWGTYLLGGVAVMVHAVVHASDPETLIYAGLAADLLSLFFVVILVVKLTRRQAQRAAGTPLPTARVVNPPGATPRPG